MQIEVFIERDNQTKKLEAKDIPDLLSQLAINSETVIITRNNELITEATKLQPKDKIRLLSVISGG